jgi:hypothetical protein
MSTANVSSVLSDDNVVVIGGEDENNAAIVDSPLLFGDNDDDILADVSIDDQWSPPAPAPANANATDTVATNTNTNGHINLISRSNNHGGEHDTTINTINNTINSNGNDDDMDDNETREALRTAQQLLAEHQHQHATGFNSIPIPPASSSASSVITTSASLNDATPTTSGDHALLHEMISSSSSSLRDEEESSKSHLRHGSDAEAEDDDVALHNDQHQHEHEHEQHEASIGSGRDSSVGSSLSVSAIPNRGRIIPAPLNISASPSPSASPRSLQPGSNHSHSHAGGDGGNGKSSGTSRIPTYGYHPLSSSSSSSSKTRHTPPSSAPSSTRSGGYSTISAPTSPSPLPSPSPASSPSPSSSTVSPSTRRRPFQSSLTTKQQQVAQRQHHQQDDDGGGSHSSSPKVSTLSTSIKGRRNGTRRGTTATTSALVSGSAAQKSPVTTSASAHARHASPFTSPTSSTKSRAGGSTPVAPTTSSISTWRRAGGGGGAAASSSFVGGGGGGPRVPYRNPSNASMEAAASPGTGFILVPIEGDGHSSSNSADVGSGTSLTSSRLTRRAIPSHVYDDSYHQQHRHDIGDEANRKRVEIENMQHELAKVKNELSLKDDLLHQRARDFASSQNEIHALSQEVAFLKIDQSFGILGVIPSAASMTTPNHNDDSKRGINIVAASGTSGPTRSSVASLLSSHGVAVTPVIKSYLNTDHHTPSSSPPSHALQSSPSTDGGAASPSSTLLQRAQSLLGEASMMRRRNKPLPTLPIHQTLPNPDIASSPSNLSPSASSSTHVNQPISSPYTPISRLGNASSNDEASNRFGTAAPYSAPVNRQLPSSFARQFDDVAAISMTATPPPATTRTKTTRRAVTVDPFESSTSSVAAPRTNNAIKRDQPLDRSIATRLPESSKVTTNVRGDDPSTMVISGSSPRSGPAPDVLSSGTANVSDSKIPNNELTNISILPSVPPLVGVSTTVTSLPHVTLSPLSLIESHIGDAPGVGAMRRQLNDLQNRRNQLNNALEIASLEATELTNIATERRLAVDEASSSLTDTSSLDRLAPSSSSDWKKSELKDALIKADHLRKQVGLVADRLRTSQRLVDNLQSQLDDIRQSNDSVGRDHEIYRIQGRLEPALSEQRRLRESHASNMEALQQHEHIVRTLEADVLVSSKSRELLLERHIHAMAEHARGHKEHRDLLTAAYSKDKHALAYAAHHISSYLLDNINGICCDGGIGLIVK